LVLTCNGFVEAETTVYIHVDVDAGILLPAEGVKLNTRIGLASTAKYGPLPINPPTYFDFVAPIGSFLESSKIVFMSAFS